MSYIGLPLTEPNGSQSLVLAARWAADTLTGTVATIVATIAIATIGFLMLQGRIDIRRSAAVVIGCFVVFGASAIASGLMDIAGSAQVRTAEVVVPTALAPVATFVPPPPQPEVYDPYAGASVPVR